MISVIIVVRNEEKNIVRMLNSLLLQKRDFGETIIVDEGSKDRTREVIKNYRGFNIILLNGGGNTIGFNRNWGGNLAKGDLLLFTEGNCFLQRRFIKRVSASFQLDKDLTAIASCSMPYGSSSFIILVYLVYDSLRLLLSRAKLGFSISGSILVVRRNVFHELRGFGYEYNDDGVFGRKIYDYCNRTGRHYKFTIDPRLAVYRSINRFHSNGFLESFRHYFYIITNFAPYLNRVLRNSMTIDEVRFRNEEHIT